MHPADRQGNTYDGDIVPYPTRTLRKARCVHTGVHSFAEVPPKSLLEAFTVTSIGKLLLHLTRIYVPCSDNLV